MVVLAGVFFLVIAGGVALASRYVKDGPKPAAPPAPKLSPQQQRCADDLERLDAMFTRWAGGADLTAEALQDADEIVRARFELAAVQSGTRDVHALRRDEQTNLFLVAIRAAAMGHPAHAAWPVSSAIRPMVVDELLRRLNLRPSLALHTAMVPAALSVGAVELAVQSLGGLRGHPRLRAEVLGWVRDMLVSSPSRNHTDPVLRFLRVVGDKMSNATTLGAPERHALRFAVLPSPAIDTRTTLADPRPPLTCRALLRTWYDVHDATSANDRLAFFLRVGVRSQVGALFAERDVAPRDAEHARRRALLASDPQGYGRRHALAFDLVRVIEIARLAHAAGYLSVSEGWTWVHSAVRELESHYDGFPDIASDYLRGHAFACDPGHESDLVELVTYLVRAPTSPWARDPRIAA